MASLHRQVFRLPLGEAAAKPVHLLIAGLLRPHRRFVALPALAPVAGEDQRRILVLGDLGQLEIVLTRVVADLFLALLVVRKRQRALAVLLLVLLLGAHVIEGRALREQLLHLLGGDDLGPGQYSRSEVAQRRDVTVLFL